MSAQHDQLIKTFGCHGATLLVHATADAEAICQKSSLSAAELLRPFTFVDTSFSITTVGEPYKLSGFHLRFVHTSEFKELTAAAADQLDAAGFVVVDTIGPPNGTVLATDPPAGEFLRKGSSIRIVTRVGAP